MIKDKKICVVDYGVGNIHSAVKALKQFSLNVLVTEDKTDIESADALVLPGVGTFESGMKGLSARNLVEEIKNFTKSGKPVLGICLGAQMLFDVGNEFGSHKGLGIISGTVDAFPPLDSGTKIPHMDWDGINIPNNKNKDYWNETILDSIESGSLVYFVHSYIMNPKNDTDVLAVTNYGSLEFASVVRNGNVFGTQFHPEKSGDVGLLIIKNFINSL